MKHPYVAMNLLLLVVLKVKNIFCSMPSSESRFLRQFSSDVFCNTAAVTYLKEREKTLDQFCQTLKM